MGKKVYFNYITGLKGVACVMIMLCHYLGVYKYSEKFFTNYTFFDKILSSRLSFVFDESFWLILFFIISGYLLSFKDINKFIDIIKNSALRFLRLGLPIFFSSFIIYFLFLIFGHNNELTTSLFINTWFQNHFGITLLDVFLSPVRVLLLGNSIINTPYWVLREMFISSVFIYILNYLKKILSFNNFFVICILLFFINYFFKSTVIISCLFGYFFSLFINNYKKLNIEVKCYVYFLLSFIFLILGKSVLNCFFFSILLFIIPKIKFLNKIFSSKICFFLGNISWGIYSFHWPLYCSFGSWLLLKQIFKMNILFPLSILLSIIFVLLLSCLYHNSCEKIENIVFNRIKKILL